MASYINTNLASLQTQRNLSTSQTKLQSSIERLSSGLRVNSAKDDAAGFAVASGMDSKIRGQNVAIRNANDAISLSQTADGALGKISDNLQRMRELAVQAANDTNSDDDRTKLNQEFAQLQDEITRVTKNTKFNDKNLLTTESGTQFKFQIGDGTDVDNQIALDVTDLSDTTNSKTGAITVKTVFNADGTVGTQGQDIASASTATAAMTAIDAALKEINNESIKQGALQNRLTSTISTLQVSVENQTAAKSRITDTDFAAETANMSRGQILQQAGMAMLSQANQLPNGVMALLR